MRGVIGIRLEEIMAMHWRLLSAALWLTATVLTTSSCTKKSKDLEADLPGGGKLVLPLNETLRVNLGTEPPSLDWHKSTDTTSAHVHENQMEPLVNYNLSDKELSLTPGLATSWEPMEKGRKWKITLRSDVKWTDGQPFVPQHVVDGWKRLLTPATASEYAYFLFAVKNAKAFNEGKVKDFNEVGIKVSGANELMVELDKPIGYFPQLLTHPSTFPIRQDIVDKYGDKWTEPQNIVTLGPYKLRVWQHDKMLVLERNESYFGPKPKVKYIAAYMIVEQATALNLFDSGKMDVLIALPSTELKTLRKRPEYHVQGSLLTFFYGFNVTKAPMDNPLVRQAISHAIDRQQIVQILGGGQIPMTSWIPSGMFGYEAERGITYNPERAKELFKKAGYGPGGKPFPKIVMKLNTNEDHKRVAENIQAQLKTNLGIEAEIQNEEWKVFLANLRSDPPNMFRSGWFADYPDPDNFMNLMISSSENNRTRWKSKAYDDLVNQAAGETDREKRRRIYSDAQRLLVEQEVPAAPLYQGVQQMLINARVQGFPLNALGRMPISEVKLQ